MQHGASSDPDIYKWEMAKDYLYLALREWGGTLLGKYLMWETTGFCSGHNQRGQNYQRKFGQHDISNGWYYTHRLFLPLYSRWQHYWNPT